MERFRRALFAWTVAGLGTATGCATDAASDGPRETVRAQQPTRPAPRSSAPVPPASLASGKQPATSSAQTTEPAPLPINLATALKLSNARPLDVQIAAQQITSAAAIYDRARVLWLANVSLGADYPANSGSLPTTGKANRNALTVGTGSNALFAFSDAIYSPLAACQEQRATSPANDPAVATADAYFALQQARGDLAGAIAAESRAEEFAKSATDATDARAELGRRKQAVTAARERERTANSELARALGLPPATRVEPAEPAFLPIAVIDPIINLDELVPVALTTRPELAGNQALVRATLARLKQESLRPLVPSLAVRSVPTSARDPETSGERFDIAPQQLREFVTVAFSDKPQTNEGRDELEGATIDLFRAQDRIAAEVATAFAQVRTAAQRLNTAEPALKAALERSQKNTSPQETTSALQALSQANTEFFAAVAEYNRAQFRLYCVLGHPNQCLANPVPQAPLAAMPLSPTPEMKPSAQPAPLASVPPVAGEMPAAPIAAAPAPVPPPASVVPPTPNTAQPLPVQEWTSVPVPGANRLPTVIEEPPLPSTPVRPPAVAPDSGS